MEMSLIQPMHENRGMRLRRLRLTPTEQYTIVSFPDCWFGNEARLRLIHALVSVPDRWFGNEARLRLLPTE